MTSYKKSAVRRVGILTGGGDCPGLNAVIRAVVKSAILDYGIEVIGIEDGFHGLIHRRTHPLHYTDATGILSRGGTILGSSNKDNPFAHIVEENGEKKTIDVSDDCIAYMREQNWDALICLGGDGTQAMAKQFFDKGFNVIGVPKTIDNDLMATDKTFGFQTAVDTATDAIDKLHTTAMAHHRVQVVEMMGRYAGWLTLHSGVAGGADVILLPEIDFDLEVVAKYCEMRSTHGKRFTIVAVAEGAKPKGGSMVVSSTVADSPDPIRLGGVGHFVADEIAHRTGLESRATVLGHLQRGGSPCSFDRILATQFGHKAMCLAAEGNFGTMPALHGNEIVAVRLADAVSRLKTVPVKHPLVQTARSVGTCFGDILPRSWE